MKDLTMSLVVKLASVAVHVEEMLSADGHAFDEHAIRGLLGDAEVRAFLDAPEHEALFPRKRAAAPVKQPPKMGRGWGCSPVLKKAHYFREGRTVSACGKIGFYMGPREDWGHESEDNCAECKKKRGKNR